MKVSSGYIQQLNSSSALDEVNIRVTDVDSSSSLSKKLLKAISFFLRIYSG